MINGLKKRQRVGRRELGGVMGKETIIIRGSGWRGGGGGGG